MRIKNILVFFLLSIATIEIAFAQDEPAKKDSTQLYENIETYSKRSNFTKFVYSLIFKSVEPHVPKKKSIKKVNKKLIQKPYSTFEGKIIRNISIQTLDPFGYSISDTNKRSQNFLLRAGNSLHVKSQERAILNLLLIRENKPFDSLLVKESERLVRKQGYVRDVSFFIKATAESSDSVDIFIRELDNWSLIPDGSFSGTRFRVDLYDKNFIGLGHDLKNSYTWYHTSGDNAFYINYFIPNIRNTFVNVNMRYGTDEFSNSIKSFAIDRPFFSPFAKWAAGINFTEEFRKDYTYFIDTLNFQQNITFNSQDFWAGNAMQVFKGNTENKRTTNFISTARFLRVRYLEKPNYLIDSAHLYANEDLYLASIGISTRKYVQDKYIFKFGVPEDVPIGKVYSLTGGYQKRNNIDRTYLSARISFGNYYSWGYFSTNIEYGTFFRASQTEQAVFKADINYFTGLFEIGRWRFRHFVKPHITIGINRFSYDSLTINNRYGLDGFNSSILSGNSRLLLTMQTQLYAPWSIIGFKFGPYFSYSLGMLGDIKTGFTNSKVYSQIGLGVLIKNENLIINTFQFSISYYPSIPGVGYDVFKTNSFKSTDFGFRDFEIGKPEIVVYR